MLICVHLCIEPKILQCYNQMLLNKSAIYELDFCFYCQYSYIEYLHVHMRPYNQIETD